MNSLSLTDSEFWKRYWQGRDQLFNIVINDNYLYFDVISAHLPMKIKTFMEIGGFPGYFSILFRKFFRAEAKLCDTYIDEAAIRRLCATNGVDSIEAIRADIFDLQTAKVDVVLSAGFIEHFADPLEIISKHFDFVNDGGYVIIGVPNFLGLNGLLQRVVDNVLYKAHNLDAMKHVTLSDACRRNNAEVLHIGYYGRFGLWLENLDGRSLVTRLILKMLNMLRYLVWFESKILSPFTLCIARKC